MTPTTDDLIPGRTDIDSWIADLYTRSGYTPELLNHITQPVTGQIAGVERACQILDYHRQLGHRVTIVTDYDMDGIMSGCIAYAGLAACGVSQLSVLTPDYRGSRALTPGDVDAVLTQWPDTRLILTCDMGITSTEGIRYAQSRGLQVIVTDHHTPGETCPADAAVNPHLPGSTISQPDICGAQTVLWLLNHYAKNYLPQATTTHALLRLMDLFAGAGAIADVMPMTEHHTRTQVRRMTGMLQHCLPPLGVNQWGSFNHWEISSRTPAEAPIVEIVKTLTSDPRVLEPFEGLATLLLETAYAKKLTSRSQLNASLIGFTLAPMVNATRRVEADMATVMAVFLPSTVEVLYSRAEAARQMIETNLARQQATRDALGELDDRFAPCIIFSEAPAGILGLIATKLTADSGLPTLVVNPHTLSGSARSPQWCDLLALAGAHPELFGAAGHAHACGVWLAGSDEDTLIRLTRVFIGAYADMMMNTPPATPTDGLGFIFHETMATIPTTVDYDPALPNPHHVLPDHSELIELVRALDHLEPFGHLWPAPTIGLIIDPAGIEVQFIGKQHQHTKITTDTGIELLWWNHRLDTNALSGAPLLVAGALELTSTTEGEPRLQMIVRSCTEQSAAN